MYFVWFSFFVVSGKRVNFILVTPSWLDVEGHFLNSGDLLLSLVQTPLLFDEVSPEHFSRLSLRSKDILWPLCIKPFSLYSYKLIMNYAFISFDTPQASWWQEVGLCITMPKTMSDKWLSLKIYPPHPVSTVLSSQHWLLFYFYYLNHL